MNNYLFWIVVMNIVVNNSIWTEKYRPKTLSDYYISKNQLDTIKEWLNDVNSEDGKPFLILYGNAGIGKTTLAHLILQKYGYEIIECNASDVRSKKQIRDTLGGIAKVSVCVDNKNVFKPTAIIMDEIDGLNGATEASGVQELVDIIVNKDKQTKNITWVCPVICTTNSVKEKKLQALMKYGVLINLEKPNNNNCCKLINKITTEEQFSLSDKDKDLIIKHANGDYRQIIMLLFEYYNKLKIKKSGDDTKVVGGDVVNSISGLKIGDVNIVEGEGYSYDINVINSINNFGDTPLDKINYFITHVVDLDVIRYFCSGDSNLFFMNFYSNLIPIVSMIQTKIINKINSKNIPEIKTAMLKGYKLLSILYNSVKNADMLNNSIFLDKTWELLDYFDIFSVGIPSKLIYSHNKLPITNTPTNTLINPTNPINLTDTGILVKEFTLTHHTQYNFMRQEQIMNKKTISSDYIKTYDNNIYSIYYNLKRFQLINKDNVKKYSVKTRRKHSDPEHTKFIIDKKYNKIIEKIDELLI